MFLLLVSSRRYFVFCPTNPVRCLYKEFIASLHTHYTSFPVLASALFAEIVAQITVQLHCLGPWVGLFLRKISINVRRGVHYPPWHVYTY
jgi:hypothetical protein